MNRLIALVELVVGACVVLFLGATLVKFVTGTTLVVDVSKATSLKGVNVYVNKKEVLALNEKSKSFRAMNQIGKKEVVIRVAGYKDYQVEVNTLWRGTKVVASSLTDYPATELAKTLDTGNDVKGYSVADAVYYQGKTWLGFKYVSSDPDKPSMPFAAHYYSGLGRWAVLNFGGENEIEPTSGDNKVPDDLFAKYFQDAAL